MASSGTEFLIRSWKASMGTAAKGTTLAESIWKVRSGIDASANQFGSGFQFCEEAGHLGPDFGSAGEAFPIGTDQADEFVALVDGRDVVLGVSQAMSMADAIHEQRFNVGLELMECRVVLC